MARVLAAMLDPGPHLHTAYITVSEHGLLIAADWPRPGLELAY